MQQNDLNVIRGLFDDQARRGARDAEALHSDGDGGNSNGMNDRISRLEGQHDGIKHSQAMMLGVLAIVAAVAVGGVTLLYATQQGTNGRIDQLEAKIDAIPGRLAEEFRAMRAEMAAQTSAIANSITATKQQAPQVILVPPPQPTR